MWEVVVLLVARYANIPIATNRRKAEYANKLRGHTYVCTYGPRADAGGGGGGGGSGGSGPPPPPPPPPPIPRDVYSTIVLWQAWSLSTGTRCYVLCMGGGSSY